MSAVRYLREDGYHIFGVMDYEQVCELARINGDLSRLGGLLKLWLPIANCPVPAGQQSLLRLHRRKWERSYRRYELQQVDSE